MEKVTINPYQPDHNKILIIREAIKNGGVIVYPTDTVYGLGADINNENALKKIYSIKGRSFNKPVSICLSSVDQIEQVAIIDDQIWKFVNKLFPGPYTLILPKKEDISPLISPTESVGVRIPDLAICKEISWDLPITTTSANISGQPTPHSIDDLISQLGGEVDILVDGGVLRTKHSTVIDLTNQSPRIVRRGAGLEKLSDFMKF